MNHPKCSFNNTQTALLQYGQNFCFDSIVGPQLVWSYTALTDLPPDSEATHTVHCQKKNAQYQLKNRRRNNFVTETMPWKVSKNVQVHADSEE